MPLPEHLKGADKVASILVARHFAEIVQEITNSSTQHLFSRDELKKACHVSLLLALSQSSNNFQEILRGEV